jgi:hypothetical protein
VAERDAALWLECSALGRRRGRVGSLLQLISPHTRRPIVEFRAAA